MRKYDRCVGHEARINKLLLKKPPGITSASSTSSECEQSADQPSRGLYWKREEKGGKTKTAKRKMKGGRRKETNPESGARHRIFGDGLCSMGLARVGCPVCFVDGMLRRSGLGR